MVVLPIVAPFSSGAALDMTVIGPGMMGGSGRDGKSVGMLSVNATSGAVWYHGWHGRFLGEHEF